MILNRVASPAHARAAGPRLLRAASRRRCWARSRAMRRWRCPAGIWGWSRQPSIPISRDLPRPRGRSGRGAGIDLDRLQRLARATQRLAARARHPPLAAARPAHRGGARPGLRLRLRGRARRLAPPGRRGCCRSRRWPTRRPIRRRMPSICPAAIPSCTPARSPATRAVWLACAPPPTRGAFVYGECGGYMALGRALVDREGTSHADGRAPARGDELRRAAAASRLPADRAARRLPARPDGGTGIAATSSTMRASSSHDGPALFRARSARGLDSVEQGCRAGR